MSRDLPPDMPRQQETWVSLFDLMLKLRGISRSSAIVGLDSPQSSNRKGNSFIPCERPNVNNTLYAIFRLPRPSPAHALMRMLH